MPEGTPDATVLIAISWQALNRLKMKNKETEVCDCTIALLFAGFFIESNLNYIYNYLNQTDQMKKYFNKKYPGLQDKLGWFYNEYVARFRAESKENLYKNGISTKLRKKFPGFSEIYKFRNDISHGVVDISVTNFEYVKKLRKQATTIVDLLFEIVKKKTEHELPRDIDYWTALNLRKSTPIFGFSPSS